MPLRANIRKRHGLTANAVDLILMEIATHAIVRKPPPESDVLSPREFAMKP